MKKIAIINYGLGNLRSVAGAVERVGFKPLITNSPKEIRDSEKMIIPGVGAFGDGIKNINELNIITDLEKFIYEDKKPVLGICLGFQLMALSSCEFGRHDGLGWIDATVEKMEGNNGAYRLPHVGWSDLIQLQSSILFEKIPKEALFYYVHSYHVVCKTTKNIIGECEYGNKFVSVIEKDNIYGTQFHPEKSQKWGLQLLKNFLEKA
ncbi:MAG: imidazole glycerol phosphate synthase subunit HisH [Desulfobacterales bacterium]|nr:imidazole glycerol phosphate synthase subunit HisH [Desulfobacterales bacterium]